MEDNRQIAHYGEHATDDIDEHARSLSRWQQVYLQLGEGLFQGHVHEIGHARLQLFHEYTSLATWQQCQPWPGAIWFGLSSSPQVSGLQFNQQATPAHHLLVCPAGEHFTLRTPAEFGVFGLVLDQAWLIEQLRQRCGCRLPHTWRQPGTLALGIEAYGQLSQALRHSLLSVRDLRHPSAQLDTLACALLPHLLAGQTQPPLDRRRAPQQPRHRQLIAQARAHILDPHHPATTVDTLAAQLFLTRRTLQNCVQHQLGVTPLQLIQTVRLQALRHDLRNPALAGASLQALAARHGFWHWSHLARAYRRRYGESLMATRRQVERITNTP